MRGWVFLNAVTFRSSVMKMYQLVYTLMRGGAVG
jgi:hypothetical protein